MNTSGANALIRYQFANYRCFRDEQELSLVASSGLKGHRERLLTPPGLKQPLLRAAGIYGTNASGKTTAIDALFALSSAVRDSFARWDPEAIIPILPFLFDADTATQPTKMEVEFLCEGVRHIYGFVCTPNAFEEEWLYAAPKGVRKVMFERHGLEVKGPRSTERALATIATITRPKSLFLSAAAQAQDPTLSPIAAWFSTRLFFVRYLDQNLQQAMLRQLRDDSRMKDFCLAMMQAADLGILDFEIEEQEFLPGAVNDTNPAESSARSRLVLFVVHRAAGGKTRKLPLFLESDGTRAFLNLLWPLFLIQGGGTLCVDELDSSLHPLLAIEILRLIGGDESNPSGIQLLFNSHETALLDSGLLARDQVWFTEKAQDGASKLYPLSDFHARREHNLASNYLAGRYGAVPYLHTLASTFRERAPEYGKK